MRPMTSADTQTYAWYYEKSGNITDFKFGIGRDYFPWVENWFINYGWFCNNVLHLDFRGYLFLCAMIFNTISLYSLISIVKTRYGKILNSGFILSIVLLFVANFGILYSYVVIRGGISFAFCLLAYSYFLKNKKIKTALSMLIAILMHNYSIVFIPILFITKIRFKKNHMKLFITLFSILFVMSLFRFDVLFTKYLQGVKELFSSELYGITHYLMDAQQVMTVRKGALLYLAQNIYIAILLYRSKEKCTSELLILLIGGLITALINDDGAIRITNYFYLFQIFLYGKYLLNDEVDGSRSRAKTINSIVITILIPVVTLIFILRYCSII